MEVEAVGPLSVERIAEDGDIQAIGVGTMYPQLMGATCMGTEDDSYCGVWSVECGVRYALSM